MPTLARLPRRLRPELRAARDLATERRERLYLAGGVIRDLLLGRPIRDVDLVVEGDALALARRLASLRGASVRTHERFGTATLALPNGARLDLAGARRETYARPGALPTVFLGASIDEDLGRRDVTVNAMAMELTAGRRLVDPFDGRSDLRQRIIRTLHARSFRDDPTRALRAVRYANRLRFRIAPATRREIREAISSGAFDAVSGDRLRRELARILGEEDRAAAVALLRRLGLDAAISPAWRRISGGPDRVRRAESIARGHLSPTWLGYLLAWLGETGSAEVRRIADRLGLVGRDGDRLRAWPVRRRQLQPGLARLGSARILERARGFSDDEILAAAAVLGAPDRRALLRHTRGPARVALAIGGSDLLSAGIPPGPAIGQALGRTLAAREGGRITRRQELDFALEAARAALQDPR